MLDNSELYDRYAVEIVVRDRLDGGVPKDPNLIASWVKAQTGHDDDRTKQQIADHLPDIEAAVDEAAAPVWCGFKQVDGRRYIEPRQVKAMLRECATVLGITAKKRGSRQILQHGFEVKGVQHVSKLFFDPAANTGSEEAAIHVQTRQGPRSAIKRNDFVGAGSVLRWQIWVLATAPQEKRHLGEKELRSMLALAQENGLGANRSQGRGKFDVVRFEPL